jgi:crossover junction endodeoxyribonuclease RuvC
LIILGIDPGTATTGFGLIEFNGYDFRLLDFGSIETSKELPHHERIRQIVSDLSSLIREYHPDQVAIEELFFSKNVTTAMKVAESRGAIIYALSESNLAPAEYKPNQVKVNICGYGSAPKIQVQKMVQIILNLKHLPRPDDAADALAIAICHANHLKHQNLYQNNA